MKTVLQTIEIGHYIELLEFISESIDDSHEQQYGATGWSGGVPLEEWTSLRM